MTAPDWIMRYYHVNHCIGPDLAAIYYTPTADSTRGSVYVCQVRASEADRICNALQEAYDAGRADHTAAYRP